jgi:asparagine synthase (glutamine-hydrolysing)
MVIDGADPETVRTAIRNRSSLAGADGFAGELDGALVRDVLGRYPIFFDPTDPETWSFDPTDLADAESVPAGHVRDGKDDTEVFTVPDPTPYADPGQAVMATRDAITDSVDAVADDTPVAFSGGVDSSILAARLDGPLYVCGFEGSHDLEAARSGADLLNRELRVVEFTHEDIERSIPTVVEAIDRTNPMDVEIALVLFFLGTAVASDGFDRLALGQGADELFGGYAKVASAPDTDRIEADTVRGATRETIASLPDGLERDVLALRAAGVEPVVPLLSDRVVSTALRLPEGLLVSDGRRKVALRQAADFLPEELRHRDKKALQYGSLLARELDRLARQAGFKRRMDDHLERYVRSVAPD